MKLFSRLFHNLDSTTKANDRIDFLVAYFKEADPLDAIWSIWFLIGNRVKGVLKTSELRQFISEFSGIPLWLVEECNDCVGDLAETVSLLIEKSSETRSEIALREIVERYLLSLAGMKIEQKRERLYEAWRLLGTENLLPFHKLITGGFRMGVSSGILYKALAKVGKVEPAIIAQRLSGEWHPDNSDMASIMNPSLNNSRICKPYPFCLAHPLQTRPESLGSREDWQVEWKWDGIRAQLVIHQDKCMLWSRGGQIVGESFPEILEATKLISRDLCLDGEILAWGRDGLRSFSHLQRRLGRKNPSVNIIKNLPVRFIAYDLLRLDKQDVRGKPLSFRRNKLELILEILPPNFPIGVSPLVEKHSWDALKYLREESRSRGVEGFMLKRKESSYETGRVKGGWYKWKIDPFLADMVVVSAQLGRGKRANLYSDYSLAVWNNEELVTVAKAYSGLSIKEIEEVDAFVRKNISGKFGPVRGVKPGLVFEIAFEGVSISNRHKSGIALRFPRIHRWRKDKNPEEIGTLDEIRGFSKMYKSYLREESSSIDEAGNLLLF